MVIIDKSNLTEETHEIFIPGECQIPAILYFICKESNVTYNMRKGTASAREKASDHIRTEWADKFAHETQKEIARNCMPKITINLHPEYVFNLLVTALKDPDITKYIASLEPSDPHPGWD